MASARGLSYGQNGCGTTFLGTFLAYSGAHRTRAAEAYLYTLMMAGAGLEIHLPIREFELRRPLTLPVGVKLDQGDSTLHRATDGGVRQLDGRKRVSDAVFSRNTTCPPFLPGQATHF